MLLEIIISLILGILAGTITGLTPGIHINLIGAFLISISTTVLTKIPTSYLIIFIASMAITHTFLDFIPSILLGCPDTDTELSILPGHELLKKGQAYQGILLTAYGSFAAIVIVIFLTFPLLKIIPPTYSLIKPITPFILIAISIFLILSEKNKIPALKVFLLTGGLGYSISFFQLNQPLLPLLSGLFGSSMILLSIKNKTIIPPQKIEKPKIRILKPLIGATLASPLCSFLPGLGSGQAAVIGNAIANQNQKGFLVLLGATNTLVMAVSFLSLYAISKTRTGAAVAINELMPILSKNILILIMITIFISGIISFFLTKLLSKIAIEKIQKLNYTKLSILILIILTIIIFLVSGLMGLLIFILSTLTGIYCLKIPVKKTQMMGSLIIPTIIWYLI